MFTGIVEELGEVVGKDDLGDSARFTIHGPVVTADASHGDSIAVNGVCLTATEVGPSSFKADAMAETLDLLVARKLPVFGVCLGLQGIVEYFGGVLDVLDVPMHGKPSLVRVLGGRLLRDLPREFTVGRYHSLYARRRSLPPDLAVTAETEDRIVMAIEHAHLPIAAVQFHPESVMTSPDAIGMPIITAMLSAFAARA